jgi:hypothetical protein
VEDTQRSFVMKKKQMVTVAALAVVALSLLAGACANPPEDFDFEIEEKGVIITGYEGKSLTPRIPSKLQGKKVVRIGEAAFQEKGLTGVTIPNSVTEIGYSAFADNQLTSVTIPKGVTSLSGFDNNRLTSVTIPKGVTSLSGFDNNRLTSVTIPKGVTSLSGFDNNRLTGVTIPNSVTEIGYSAFADNQLTSVTIPDSVTEIGAKAFAHNQLTSVTIPDSVTEISVYAFTGMNNDKLTSVTIGANVALVTEGGGWNSFPNGFGSYYNRNGKKAGTYTLSDGQWAYQQ